MDSKYSACQPCCSVFDQWLIRKARLERGQKVLSTLEANYFITKDIEDDSYLKHKHKLLQELILCSVAIDCSIENLQSKTDKKKSMKESLCKWLIQQGFMFENVPIHKNIHEKFSENAKEFMFVTDSCGSIKMLTCAYSKTKGITLDQQVQNSLFLAEYNREWNIGISKLRKKCKKEMKNKVAESKTSLESSSLFDQDNDYNETKNIKYKISQQSEMKQMDRDHEKGCKDIESKEEMHQPFECKEQNAICASTFGVSDQIFQNFLSFGITRLIGIEKDYKSRQKVEDRQEKALKKLEAKRAHKQWKEKKAMKQKDKIVQDPDDKEVNDARIENYPHLFRSSRLMSKKCKVTTLPRNAAPRIYMKQQPDNNNYKVTLHWETLNELKTSDFFIITLGNEKDGNTASKVWRDPPESGKAHSLKREIQLDPLLSHWFTVRIYTSNGTSPESRFVIPSIPRSPSAPILIKASESSAKISWISSKNNNPQITKNDAYIVELCIDDEKDKWIKLWKGQNNVATLNGLSSDTAYKVRVLSRNEQGFCGSPGDASIFYTRLKTPQPPRLVNKEKSVGKDFFELCWDETNTEFGGDDLVSCVSISKCFYSIDIDRKGWINEYQLNDLLITLGVIIDSEQSVKKAMETLSFNPKRRISYDTFCQWWKKHLIYTVHQRLKEDESDNAIVVYKGTDRNVKLRKLAENTSYYYTISCTTLRGSSNESKPLHLHTLPGCPKQIVLIQVDFNNILLKIVYNNGCKIRIEKMEEADNAKQARTHWSKVYEGNGDIVKVTSLRSNRKYRFRCQCVNRGGGTSDFIFSGTIKTSISKFQLNTRTINNLFIIDCTNAITHGDLILFTETANYVQPNTKNQRIEKDGVDRCSAERCVIARVLSINSLKTRPEGVLIMEVAWVSSSHDISKNKYNTVLRLGTMIERSLRSVNTYEVLRMPWVNERERI